MDGALDSDNDILPVIAGGLGRPFVWYKTTICCFRLGELIEHYRDAGWDVHPLLVVRDARRVWASLSTKHYGRNSTTAEDPPLRLRLRRFKDDWELARRKDWPQVVFERFVAQPEATLHTACEQLGLPWDEAMVTWPKPARLITDARHGNRTFHGTRSRTLLESVKTDTAAIEPGAIRPDDLAWLEQEFADFNRVNGYPAHIAASSPREGPARATPLYEHSRRLRWDLHRKPLQLLAYLLGMRHFATRRGYLPREVSRDADD